MKRLFLVGLMVTLFSLSLSVRANESRSLVYTTANVNMRETPQVLDNVLTTVKTGTQVELNTVIVEQGTMWAFVTIGDTSGYIRSDYLSSEEPPRDISINSKTQFKSYMSYSVISRSSQQGKLQQLAETEANGLRTVDGYYTIAVGSGCNVSIGQRVDVCLQSGVIIPCCVGDIKADKDTDERNLVTSNGCATEFIVDTSTLPRFVKTMGDVSYLDSLWLSPVQTIKVYNEFLLEE